MFRGFCLRVHEPRNALNDPSGRMALILAKKWISLVHEGCGIKLGALCLFLLCASVSVSALISCWSFFRIYFWFKHRNTNECNLHANLRTGVLDKRPCWHFRKPAGGSCSWGLPPFGWFDKPKGTSRFGDMCGMPF